MYDSAENPFIIMSFRTNQGEACELITNVIQNENPLELTFYDEVCHNGEFDVSWIYDSTDGSAEMIVEE